MGLKVSGCRCRVWGLEALGNLAWSSAFELLLEGSREHCRIASPSASALMQVCSQCRPLEEPAGKHDYPGGLFWGQELR